MNRKTGLPAPILSFQTQLPGAWFDSQFLWIAHLPFLSAHRHTTKADLKLCFDPFGYGSPNIKARRTALPSHNCHGGSKGQGARWLKNLRTPLLSGALSSLTCLGVAKALARRCKKPSMAASSQLVFQEWLQTDWKGLQSCCRLGAQAKVCIAGSILKSLQILLASQTSCFFQNHQPAESRASSDISPSSGWQSTLRSYQK